MARRKKLIQVVNGLFSNDPKLPSTRISFHVRKTSPFCPLLPPLSLGFLVLMNINELQFILLERKSRFSSLAFQGSLLAFHLEGTPPRLPWSSFHPLSNNSHANYKRRVKVGKIRCQTGKTGGDRN